MKPSGNDRIANILIQALETEILPSQQPITPETNLEESGLDSLGLTQLLLRVEEETGFWLEEKHLTPENLETVQTLTECINEQRPQSQ